MTRKEEDISLSNFTHILDQLDPKLTELLVLHSDGEPLLNPDIFEMIAQAKDKGFQVMTSTNATLLDERRARDLIRAGLDILTISLDAVSRDVYRVVRRGGNFESVMKNVDHFLRIKGKRPPFCALQFIQMKENEHEAMPFIRKWDDYRKYNALPVVKPVTNWFEEQENTSDEYNLCERPWSVLFIHSNGNAVSCAHDVNGDYVLGSALETNVYDLWNSEKMVRLRKGLLTGRHNIEICNKCNVTAPRKQDALTRMALASLDMSFIARLLAYTGYQRPQQY